MVSLLNTDLYQLSMAYAHWKNGNYNKIGTAEAFFRKLPEGLDYAVMCGNHRIEALGDMKLNHQEYWYLVEGFGKEFVEWLRVEVEAGLKIGIRALPQGTIFDENVPCVQVTGRLPFLHLLETSILSILNHDVRVATVASHMRCALPDKQLWEFGSRRTDVASAVNSAIAAYVGGFDGTSNVMAGKYGVPVSGTMAHAWVQSYGKKRELQSFIDFMEVNYEGTTLLIDTYDIENGVLHAMQASNFTKVPLKGVRIDSGDFWEEVPKCRQLLDRFDFHDTKIFVSNDISLDMIRKMVATGLADQIDGFGIGTKLVQPTNGNMGFVYKLVDIEGTPVMKHSKGGKATLPGAKKVLRCADHDGISDILALKDERVLNEHGDRRTGVNLLQDITFSSSSIETGREVHQEALKTLDRLNTGVIISPGLTKLTQELVGGTNE